MRRDSTVLSLPRPRQSRVLQAAGATPEPAPEPVALTGNPLEVGRAGDVLVRLRLAGHVCTGIH